MKISINMSLNDTAAPAASMTAYDICYKEDVDRLVKVAAGLNGIFADFKKPVKQEKVNV